MMGTRAASGCLALPAILADRANSVALLVDCGRVLRESGKKQTRSEKESRENQPEFPQAPVFPRMKRRTRPAPVLLGVFY